MTTLPEIYKRSSRSFFLTAKNLYWQFRPTPQEQRRHLFVAGVQRSGTNMLMDILEKSWNTSTYHERDPRAFDNYKMRELPVIEALAKHSPMPLFVIKALFELQELPDLMHHFSPAKTVWIVRNYNDTVNSTLNSFRRNLVARINRAVQPDTDEWLGAGMSDETRKRLHPLVHTDMKEEDAAALQWYFRNVLFFEMGFDDRHADVLAMSYEELVTAPEMEIQRLCRFIDIPYVPRLSEGIFSSSVGKRRKPAISPPVAELCSELEHRFRRLTHVPTA